MKPFYDRGGVTLYLGDCREVLPTLGLVESCITDPPYGLAFMGNAWDLELPGVGLWRVIAAALRPGAHLLAFGGTRSWHRLASVIEGAGLEIRDTLMWLYGGGFPKSLNLVGAFEGWGTALKPGWEPILLAMRPCEGTVAENADRHGVAGLAIDAARIPVGDAAYARNCSGDRGHEGTRPMEETRATDMRQGGGRASAGGRWPANVVLDEAAAEMLDEQTGQLTSGANPTRRGSPKTRTTYGDFVGQEACEPARGVDRGGASRFFYCAKASREERNRGCEELPSGDLRWSKGKKQPGTFQGEGTDRTSPNNHPTVKPIDLMRWLCRLTKTPTGGTVLDPFAGSGSTLIAAHLENRPAIGIEREERYCEIAARRIDAALDDVSLFTSGAA